MIEYRYDVQLLIEGKDFALLSRTKSLCNVPSILFGSKLVDEGNYLFTEEENLFYKSMR